MTKAEIETELATWIEVFHALQDDKDKLAAFEKKMAKRVNEAINELYAEAKAGLKQIEKEGGSDWSSYLEDFEVCRWENGDFQEDIADYIKQQIKAHLS